MKSRTKSPALSRRQFVTMVAAGSAALIASPLGAAGAVARRHHGAAASPTGLGLADRKELARERKSTADVLAVIRKHAMSPGTELAATFRPVRSARRSG